MKVNWTFVFGVAGVSFLLTASTYSAFGENAVASTPFIELSAVSVPEMPAKAADLVQAATASARVRTVQDALRAVSVIARPGVLPYVVSAICSRSPEAAGATVAAACGMKPQMVLIFCRAAVCAAPAQVEEIVYSACRAMPAAWIDVAETATAICPSAGDSILEAVGRARPDLELYLEEAQRNAGTNGVHFVLNQAMKSFNETVKSQGK
jgi:hypothetical protein